MTLHFTHNQRRNSEKKANNVPNKGEIEKSELDQFIQNNVFRLSMLKELLILVQDFCNLVKFSIVIMVCV